MASQLIRPESAEQVRTRAAQLAQKCTFNAYRQSQALLMPTGVALVISAFAASRFACMLPSMPRADEEVVGGFLDKIITMLSKHFIETDYGQSHVMSMLAFVIFAVAGVWVLAHARHEREEFQATNPYINDRASADELKAAWNQAKRLALLALGFLVAAIVIFVLTQAGADTVEHSIGAILGGTGRLSQDLAQGVVFLLVATTAWCGMRAQMIRHAPSRFLYNCDCLQKQSLYKIHAKATGAIRALLMVEKEELERARLVGNIALVAGVLVSAALFFLPSISTGLWWLGAIVGFVVRLVVIWLSRVRAQLRFQALAERDAEAAQPGVGTAVPAAAAAAPVDPDAQEGTAEPAEAPTEQK